jgi:peptidoglycan/LPS O-acetylase OafA/YrhL
MNPRQNIPIPAAASQRPAAPSLADHAYYPGFDWLRAACACAVMWYHGNVLTWSQSGNFGVQIFFALSGWLIGGILLKLSPADLPRFYFNRAVRIWIPYYLAAALLLALSAIREPITPKWIEIVIYKMAFVYNLFGVPQLALFHEAMPQKGTLSHFWSVNVEEQFYLAAPFLLVLLARRFGRSPLLWAALAFLGLTRGVGAITLGVLASAVMHRYGPLHLHRTARPLLWAALAITLVALALDLDYERVSPFAGLFIVLLLAVPGKRSAVGAIAGGMSYPLYLNHWVGIFVANFLMGRLHAGTGISAWALNAFLQAAIDIPIAVALYWFIDRRLLIHRAGWYSPRRGAVVTFAAYAIIVVGVAYGFAMRPGFEQARRAAAAAARESPGASAERSARSPHEPSMPPRPPAASPGQ